MKRNRKYKLDRYDIGVIVNALSAHRTAYGEEASSMISELLLRLIDEYEKLSGVKKTKLAFQPQELRLIRLILLDWRNEKLQSGDDVHAELISEVTVKLM